MKKGTSAIHGTKFFFSSKAEKGHGAAPFYFSFDKTLGKCQII
jgi:hypothetical protein